MRDYSTHLQCTDSSKFPSGLIAADLLEAFQVQYMRGGYVLRKDTVKKFDHLIFRKSAISQHMKTKLGFEPFTDLIKFGLCRVAVGLTVDGIERLIKRVKRGRLAVAI